MWPNSPGANNLGSVLGSLGYNLGGGGGGGGFPMLNSYLARGGAPSTIRANPFPPAPTGNMPSNPVGELPTAPGYQQWLNAQTGNVPLPPVRPQAPVAPGASPASGVSGAAPARSPFGTVQYNVPGSGYRPGQGPTVTSLDLSRLFGR